MDILHFVQIDDGGAMYAYEHLRIETFFELFNAYVSFRFPTNAVLVGRVRNLTDKVYARSITGTPMSFLGAPRPFELSLRLGF